MSITCHVYDKINIKHFYYIYKYIVVQTTVNKYGITWWIMKFEILENSICWHIFLNQQCRCIESWESRTFVPTRFLTGQDIRPGWSFDVSTNVRGGHLMWAWMSGWSFGVSTNVRPCQKSCGNECPWERMSVHRVLTVFLKSFMK